MNAFQFLRHPAESVSVGDEASDIFLSMAVGFSMSLKVWSKYKRLAESE
jgi:hypothetical protein